jgi:hypothetical protein
LIERQGPEGSSAGKLVATVKGTGDSRAHRHGFRTLRGRPPPAF